MGRILPLTPPAHVTGRNEFRPKNILIDNIPFESHFSLIHIIIVI